MIGSRNAIRILMSALCAGMLIWVVVMYVQIGSNLTENTELLAVSCTVVQFPLLKGCTGPGASHSASSWFLPKIQKPVILSLLNRTRSTTAFANVAKATKSNVVETDGGVFLFSGKVAPRPGHH